MQNQSLALYLFILSNGTLALAQEEKEFLVPTIESELRIDGVGDEMEWNASVWQSDFWMWRPADSLQATKQTRFKFLRNEKNLFILVESDADGTDFTTPNLKRDFSTYPTDYLTLLFDTFSDATNAFSVGSVALISS